MDVLPATTELQSLRSAELDRLFRASPAGPIPDGDATGTALLLPGTAPGRVLALATQLLLWQGKAFDRAHRRVLNKITPLGLHGLPATARLGSSLVDGAECVVLDYSGNPGPAGRLRDELRLAGPDLYVGMAFLHDRRFATFVLRMRADEPERW